MAGFIDWVGTFLGDILGRTSLVNLERMLLVVVDLLLIFVVVFLDLANLLTGGVVIRFGRAGRGVNHPGEGHVAAAAVRLVPRDGIATLLAFAVLGRGGLLALNMLLLILIWFLLLLRLLVLRVVGEDGLDVEPLHPVPVKVNQLL